VMIAGGDSLLNTYGRAKSLYWLVLLVIGSSSIDSCITVSFQLALFINNNNIVRGQEPITISYLFLNRSEAEIVTSIYLNRLALSFGYEISLTSDS
jgi:hypothetical protein